MKLHQKRLLDKGEKLVSALRSTNSSNPEVAEKIRIETDYFERNAERMRYPKFRGQHLFVGSGVIEAGCKTVIGSRLKRSGMFWTVRGANSILPCDAVTSKAASRTTGWRAARPNLHFYVAHPHEYEDGNFGGRYAHETSGRGRSRPRVEPQRVDLRGIARLF